MKMLTTQINGLFQRIASANADAIEETARLLAQATIGEGRIILAGFGEMESITVNAMHSAEPFIGVIPFMECTEIETADRVWLLTRSAMDRQALELAQSLAERFIPFAVLAAEKPSADNELADIAYTYMYTGVLKGLLPSDDGGRFVQPHALASLFVYEAVKMAYDEIIQDE